MKREIKDHIDNLLKETSLNLQNNIKNYIDDALLGVLKEIRGIYSEENEKTTESPSNILPLQNSTFDDRNEMFNKTFEFPGKNLLISILSFSCLPIGDGCAILILSVFWPPKMSILSMSSITRNALCVP